MGKTMVFGVRDYDEKYSTIVGKCIKRVISVSVTIFILKLTTSYGLYSLAGECENCDSQINVLHAQRVNAISFRFRILSLAALLSLCLCAQTEHS